MTETSQASIFELDQEAIACPQAFYEQMRQQGPVIYVEAIGAWVVTRYQDIRQVLAQPQRYSNRYPTGPRYAERMRRAMGAVLKSPNPSVEAIEAAERGRWEVLLTADPPLHDRQRRLVNRGFTPRQLVSAEPQITEIAHRLIDRFVGRGTVEFVGEFGVPLPLEVIATRLGVPLSDLAMFKRWSDDASSIVGNHSLSTAEFEEVLESLGKFYHYFAVRLAEARDEPRDDILSALAVAEIDGDRLSDDEALGMLQQFLVAGNETTTNLLTMALLRLARDSSLARELRTDPAKIAVFVEEVLRLDAPSQGMFRMAKQDVDVAGTTIPKGDHLFLYYAAANHEEEAFVDAERVRLDRPTKGPHLGFGHGTHFCLGAGLARQEARIGLAALLTRLDDIALADDAVTEYHASYFLHGIKALKLTFTPVEIQHH